MRFRVLLSACLLGGVAGGCARHPTVTPVPDMLAATGMLMRTVRIPLSSELELRRYELLQSDVSNDFYPHNISRAKPAGGLVSKLFVRNGGDWTFADFATMPRAAYGAPHISSSGDRIVYERPDVAAGEGNWPRTYGYGRSRRVAIFHRQTAQRFLLDDYTEVYGLGRAGFWRKDEESLAFTSRCMITKPPCRTLVVLDACGKALLDAAIMPELKDLEFISHGPAGRRIAALRPAVPREGGRHGGVVVEVDTTQRKLRQVGEIPSTVACRYVGRFEELIEWGAAGRCALSAQAAKAPPKPTAGQPPE